MVEKLWNFPLIHFMLHPMLFVVFYGMFVCVFKIWRESRDYQYDFVDRENDSTLAVWCFCGIVQVHKTDCQIKMLVAYILVR